MWNLLWFFMSVLLNLIIWTLWDQLISWWSQSDEEQKCTDFFPSSHVKNFLPSSFSERFTHRPRPGSTSCFHILAPHYSPSDETFACPMQVVMARFTTAPLFSSNYRSTMRLASPRHLDTVLILIPSKVLQLLVLFLLGYFNNFELRSRGKHGNIGVFLCGRENMTVRQVLMCLRTNDGFHFSGNKEHK